MRGEKLEWRLVLILEGKWAMPMESCVQLPALCWRTVDSAQGPEARKPSSILNVIGRWQPG